MPAHDLPVAEFAFPGPLRDQLVAAILAGAKTTTTGLVADYEHENEPLPGPGLRQAVVDSPGRPVAVIETTAVRVIRRRRHSRRGAGIPAHSRLSPTRSAVVGVGYVGAHGQLRDAVRLNQHRFW